MSHPRVKAMPDFSDKRTTRLGLPKQIRVSQVMLRQIKALADSEDRRMQDQVLHLLKLGIETANSKRKGGKRR
jgi:hypothetical protein